MVHKRILITGAAGFIGFHTAYALKSRGDFVIGYDQFNSYYDPRLKRARAKVLQEQGVEIVEADINDRSTIENLIASHQITHVLHLAAQAGVRHSMKDPDSYVYNNVQGFVHILEALKRFAHVRLTFASSSSVYGLNTKIPFAESDPTDTPASFYGATKKCNEVTAHAYHHLYGIHCTALRYFTVYGPWGRPDMAYFTFTQSILEGKPISVYANGILERDFTYIDDIVSGTIAALDLGSPLETFNLGNNRPESVLTLIRSLENLLGRKAHILFEPMPPGDVPMTFADITKSQRLLNYQPSISLDVGLQRFIEWYQSYTGSAAWQQRPLLMPLTLQT